MLQQNIHMQYIHQAGKGRYFVCRSVTSHGPFSVKIISVVEISETKIGHVSSETER